MDDNMEFQKREESQNFDQNPRIYYSGGGGGGGKPINIGKSSFFSRVCYSDPQNPGKMICKNQSSEDYFDGEKNRRFERESPEEYIDDFFSRNNRTMNNPYENPYHTNGENQYSFVRDIRNKLSNLFGSNSVDANEINYDKKNSSMNNFNMNDRNPYNNFPGNFNNVYNSAFDEIEKIERLFNLTANMFNHQIFNNSQNNPFFNDFNDGHHSIESFFNDRNVFHGRNDFRNYEDYPGQNRNINFNNNHEFNQNNYKSNNYPNRNSNHFNENQNSFHDNPNNIDRSNIKFRDHKVYDV